MSKKISTKKTISDLDIHASLDKYGFDIDEAENLWRSSTPKLVMDTEHYSSSDNSPEAKTKFYVEQEPTLQSEWDSLFKEDDILQKLQKSALDGNLGTNRFRSVCWRIFWECLSDDPKKWRKDVEEKRRMYSEIRKKYVINPHQDHEKDEVDLEKHHPLSLAEDSIWNKYFQDNELRNLIVQDLDRLFPEIEFFQQEKIKNYLLHILFCYAREHPQVSYKQGMHEILSPLLFVMYKNCEIISQTKDEISEEIKILLDMNYLEHDAYCLFYMIMESIQPWYVDLRPIETSQQQGQAVSNDRSIFQNPDSRPVNAISNKLQRIQGSLLQKYDPELCFHLKKIDLTPQVYGIRWVRLLFGREFPINRLFILWDAIFANGMAMELVEYIYVAMLIHLRGVLLQNDISNCLVFLMKFPADTDARFILKRAVTLKLNKNKPTQHQRRHQHPHHHQQQRHSNPPRHAITQPQRNYTPTGAKTKPSIHPVKYRLGETEEQRYANALGSGVPTAQSSPKRNRETSKSSFFVQHPDEEDNHQEFDKTEFSGEKPNKSKASSTFRDRVESGAQIISRLPNTFKDVMASTNISPKPNSNNYVNAIIEDHGRLQQQVSELQSQLDTAQTMAVYCSQKMDQYLDLMQERLFLEESFSDELAFLSLAGLKQVREVLRGKDLDDVDFTDIDRHIDVAKQQFAKDTDGERKSDLPVAMLAKFDHFDSTDTTTEDNGKAEHPSNSPIDSDDKKNYEEEVREKEESTKTKSKEIDEKSSNKTLFQPLTSHDVEPFNIRQESPQLGKKDELGHVGPNHANSFTEPWTDPLSSFTVDND